MLLFFDTETTGLPSNYDAPASDVQNWPRLVQIAWMITEEDGEELRSQSFIIRPEGFEIPLSASNIHGITTEKAQLLGTDLRTALTAFAKDLSEVEILIAHNMQFDERVVGAEFHRTGKIDNQLTARKRYCTKMMSTNFCRLPGGPHGYKWPSLEELHNILFGCSFESAHDATADLQACAKCFFELKRKGIIVDGQADDTDNPELEEDRALFDEIYDLTGFCSWFDTSRFVDSVYSQFESRKFISPAQRDALNRIRDMLEERS